MKSLITGKGEACPKCGNAMERQTHKPEWRPKPDACYFFAYWDYCRVCRHLQHYEEAKRPVEPVDEATLF